MIFNIPDPRVRKMHSYSTFWFRDGSLWSEIFFRCHCPELFNGWLEGITYCMRIAAIIAGIVNTMNGF